VFRILFQRGVYPSDDFHMVKKYGQTVLVTQDLALENYLDRCVFLPASPSPLISIRILKQVNGKPPRVVLSSRLSTRPSLQFCIEWLLTGAVTQLVLAIISKDTRIPLERWVFDINVVEPPSDSAEPYVLSFVPPCSDRATHIPISPPPKPESEIQAEIRSILKQIVSTVTFLPIIDDPTVFNILAYTKDSVDIPADEWVDTDPLAIEASKSQQVKLRNFSTDVHRIEAMVAYRYEG